MLATANSLGTITALEPDPRREGAASLRLDDQRYLTVSWTVIAAEQITVGTAVTEALHARLCRAADLEAAYAAVLHALAHRAYAAGELARKLVHRGHPPAAAAAAVERATGLGLLDDAAFAEQFVRGRWERGHGPRRIRRDLTARGVAPPVVDRALEEVVPAEEAMADRIRALIEARRARMAGLPRPAQIRRIGGYLARRGYEGPAVRRLLRRLLAGD